MGNPVFYYYPVAGGSLQTIDLGLERLSDLIVTRERAVSDSVSRAMGIHRDCGGMRERVRIVIEHFSQESLVRQFHNLSTHLERGGTVGFCLDSSKVWGGYISGHSTPGALYQGHQLVTVPGSNSWSVWSAGALSDNDPIIIESAPPESISEQHSMNGSLSATATTVFFDDKLENNFSSPSIVRYKDFWPYLKLPDDMVSNLSSQQIVISHRRRSYTLDLTLVVDWQEITSRNRGSARYVGGSDSGSQIKGVTTVDRSSIEGRSDTVVVDGLGRVIG